LAAQTNASAMPVLPLVGSTMTVSRSMRPSRSPASIIARPMRSFTLASGLKNSHLASTVACSFGHQPVDADQRRAADRLGDVVEDRP
jgi:hypothetical protein